MVQVVVVSSHSREIAEEVHQAAYLDTLSDMSYSAAQVGMSLMMIYVK